MASYVACRYIAGSYIHVHVYKVIGLLYKINIMHYVSNLDLFSYHCMHVCVCVVYSYVCIYVCIYVCM